MNDRELLEMAAKAAGVFLTRELFDATCTSPWTSDMEPRYDAETGSMRGQREWYDREGELAGWEEFIWNPLTDDGDALRLAVKLNIDVGFTTLPDGPVVEALCSWADKPRCDSQDLGKDPHAATRRAIVRAAASMVEDQK